MKYIRTLAISMLILGLFTTGTIINSVGQTMSHYTVESGHVWTVLHLTVTPYLLILIASFLDGKEGEG